MGIGKENREPSDFIRDIVAIHLSEFQSLTNPQGETTSYGYDKAGNQILVNYSNGTYSYDSNGNQISKARVNGSGAAQTTTYEWDFENRLTSVSSPTGTTSYAYDGDGNRVSKIDASGPINYINDINLPLVQVLMETDEAGNALASYTIGNDLISMRRGDETFYYHYDALGSVVALTDERGKVVAEYDYSPFGRIIDWQGGESLRNHFTYTGREYDRDSGLYFYRARYYDSRVGRFGQVDPLLSQAPRLAPPGFRPALASSPSEICPTCGGRNSGFSSPVSAPAFSPSGAPIFEHPYVYVGNHPIRYTDPLGLEWEEAGRYSLNSPPECAGNTIRYHYAMFKRHLLPEFRNHNSEFWECAIEVLRFILDDDEDNSRIEYLGYYYLRMQANVIGDEPRCVDKIRANVEIEQLYRGGRIDTEEVEVLPWGDAVYPPPQPVGDTVKRVKECDASFEIP